MALSFGQQWGYPQPLTPEELAQQQQLQQQILLDQKKQERLNQQRAYAEQLRDRPTTKSTSPLSAIGDAINRHAGRRDAYNLGGEQKGLDESLSAAKAAEYANAQKMQQRSELITLAESKRAAQEKQDELRSLEKRSGQSAWATVEAARIRAAASRAGAAAQKEIEPRTYVSTSDPDAAPIGVHPYVDPKTGKKTWSYEDPLTGDWLENQTRPPKGYRWDREHDRTTREVLKAETVGGERRKTERVKAEERRITLGAEIEHDLRRYAAKGAIKMSLQSQQNIADYAEIELKESGLMTRLNREIRADRGAQKRAEAHEKFIQGAKDTAAYERLVTEYDEKTALKVMDIAATEQILAFEQEHADKQLAAKHQAAMDQLDVKLSTEENLHFTKLKHERQNLRMELEQEMELDGADRDYKKMAAMRDQMYEIERMEYDFKHERWLEQQKNRRHEEDLAAEAAGKLNEEPAANDLNTFRKAMEPHEAVGVALDNVINHFKPYADAGLDLEGVGTGDVNENAAIRFLFQSGMEKEIGVGSRSSNLRGTAIGEDGQLIEYTVAPGWIGQWMRKQTNEAQVGYALIQQLAQKIAKAQSGLEVPHQEYLRIIAGMGVGELISDETFMHQMNQLADIQEQALRTMYYGTTTKIANHYMRNPKSILSGGWIDVDDGQRFQRLGYPQPGSEVPMPPKAPVGYQPNVVNPARDPMPGPQAAPGGPPPGPVTESTQSVLPNAQGAAQGASAPAPAPQVPHMLARPDPTQDPNASLPAAAAAASQVPEGGLLEEARAALVGTKQDLNVPRRPPTELESSAAHIPATLAKARKPDLVNDPAVDSLDPRVSFNMITDPPTTRGVEFGATMAGYGMDLLRKIASYSDKALAAMPEYDEYYAQYEEYMRRTYKDRPRVMKKHSDEAEDRLGIFKLAKTDAEKAAELREEWIEEESRMRALKAMRRDAKQMVEDRNKATMTGS